MSHTATQQTTLQHAVSCHGVALHSGADVTLTLKPAPADHGIVFMRTDVDAEQADKDPDDEVDSDVDDI